MKKAKLVPFLAGVLGFGFFLSDLFLFKWTYWGEGFQKLCQTDPDCPRLLDARGEWKVPKKTHYQLLTSIRPLLEEAAQLYKVPLDVMASVLIAEDIMNSGFTDEIQDWLLENSPDLFAKILLHDFTFGPGQINLETAIEVEYFSAKVEGRALRTEKDIRQKILQLRPSIFYIASILRSYHDRYLLIGIDLNEHKNIWSSLYNLGEIDERVIRIRQLIREKGRYVPQENYFGFFYRRYFENKWP
jgi:hypothetical protein